MKRGIRACWLFRSWYVSYSAVFYIGYSISLYKDQPDLLTNFIQSEADIVLLIVVAEALIRVRLRASRFRIIPK